MMNEEHMSELNDLRMSEKGRPLYEKVKKHIVENAGWSPLLVSSILG